MILQIITSERELESNLRRQVCDLKAELGSINMVDEFAKYAKIQRKINKVTDELSHQAQVRSTYTFKVRIIVTAVLYAIMGFSLLYLMIYYNSVPILQLPSKWLYPLNRFLALPSDVPDGIGIPAWLLVCHTVGRVVAKYLD